MKIDFVLGPSIPELVTDILTFKLWPLLHMTLAVGGTLNTNTTTLFAKVPVSGPQRVISACLIQVAAKTDFIIFPQKENRVDPVQAALTRAA